MTEEEIQTLMKRIGVLGCCDFNGECGIMELRNPYLKRDIEKEIRSFVSELEWSKSLRIAELEAKAVIYEKIISNSNFASVIKQVREKEK